MSTKNAALAQLDRVIGYEPKGQGFESLTLRQTKIPPNRVVFLFVDIEKGFEHRGGYRR